jgi:hypothetical protein
VAEASRKSSKDRQFEVLVSFDSLDKGERFTAPADAWSNQHVETGYLRDVTSEPTAAQAQGSVAPVASQDRVEEAQNGSGVGKG